MLDRDPRIETHEDVLYVPLGIEGAAPGIYDRGRRLVTASGFFRGVPSLHLVHGRFCSTVDPDMIAEGDTCNPLVFVGHFEAHYGHYLLSSLSRLWWLPYAPDPTIKLLVLDQAPLGRFFEIPFVRDILTQLGLGPDNFVSFDRPTRLRQLVVPAPSFEENNLAHRAFARLCNRIGSSLTGTAPPTPNPQPVYLSKARLQAGVSSIVNEDRVCGFLERHGVRVVYPEQLPFAEQVEIFQSHGVVAGTIGSALHTGIFVPRNRMLVLNHGNEVWSNQLLLDGINDNNTLYLHPYNELTSVGSDASFGNNFRLSNPDRLASEFLRALEAFMDGKASEPAAVQAPYRVNLARGRRARQSSICSASVGSTVEEDAAGAVSGRLTGSYQFHTDIEDQPWWDVDLGALCLIEEVRIFNRLDHVAWRSARVRILLSTDGDEWIETMRREDSTPFGGRNSIPFTWRPCPSATARYVRLQLLDRQVFHLDQVEVFGAGLSS